MSRTKKATTREDNKVTLIKGRLWLTKAELLQHDINIIDIEIAEKREERNRLVKQLKQEQKKQEKELLK